MLLYSGTNPVANDGVWLFRLPYNNVIVESIVVVGHDNENGRCFRALLTNQSIKTDNTKQDNALLSKKKRLIKNEKQTETISY